MSIYNIYLDESSIDNPKNHFMVIWGIFLKRELKNELKNKIKLLREKNKVYTEIKWSKISKVNLNFIKEIIDLFFQYWENEFQFHSIVVDKRDVDYKEYHNNDKELWFYKFMYQLLKQKIISENKYYIFIDFKQTKVNNRLKELNKFLDKWNICHLQSYHSFDNIFIQIADLFTWAIWNNKNNFSKSIYKKEIIDYISLKVWKSHLLFKSLPSEKKFNIFEIDLKK